MGPTDDDAILQSIGQRQSVMMQPLVTLTLYIPSSAVGAVIGRRGQTIAQVQRIAGQASATHHPVRVSVIGGDGGPVDVASLPYTYSDLDFSDPTWTPVVIRADPRAAFTAAAKLEEILAASDSAMDDVVLDVPLGRQRHSAVVGKRGLVLANLSADTQVRIMVPNKDRRHDVVQLEGRLANVKLCLDRILTVASKAATPTTATGPDGGAAAPRSNTESAPASSARPATTTTTSAASPGGGGATAATTTPAATTATHTQTILVPQAPSQTKIRGLSRKTDTIIKKKRVTADGSEGEGTTTTTTTTTSTAWQLTVTGPSPEQVQSAVQALQKSAAASASSAAASTSAESGASKGPGESRGSAAPPPSGPSASTPKRGRNRGRGGGGGGGGGGGNNNNNKGSAKRRGSGSTNKGDPAAAVAAAAPSTSSTSTAAPPNPT